MHVCAGCGVNHYLLTLKAMSSAMKKSDAMRTEALLAVLPALAASSPHWMVVTLAPAPLNVMYGLVAGSVTFSLKLHNSTSNNNVRSYSL